MRRCTLVVLAFLPLMAQAAGPLDKFGWFAQVVGSCWQGTFPDGTTMHSHCYTSQFDQFIRGTATLSADHDGTKEQQFSGDSVFAWNDKAQRITYYIWGSDGSYGQHEAFYDGEDLAFPVYSKKVRPRSHFARYGTASTAPHSKCAGRCLKKAEVGRPS
jgi:hypothetical protein